MRRFWKLLCSLVVPAVLLTTVVGAGPAGADVGVAQQGTVGEVPWNRTPYVMNNKVFDMAEVGGRIVVVGSFTEVRNAPANGGATFAQRSVFAFDPATGALDQSFLPQINGNVNAVLPGPGGTVYLGGSFTTVNGATTGTRNLVQLSMADGQRVPDLPRAGDERPGQRSRAGRRPALRRRLLQHDGRGAARRSRHAEPHDRRRRRVPGRRPLGEPQLGRHRQHRADAGRRRQVRHHPRRHAPGRHRQLQAGRRGDP